MPCRKGPEIYSRQVLTERGRISAVPYHSVRDGFSFIRRSRIYRLPADTYRSAC